MSWVFKEIGIAIVHIWKLLFPKDDSKWAKSPTAIVRGDGNATAQQAHSGTGHVLNINAPVENLSIGNAGVAAERHELLRRTGNGIGDPSKKPAISKPVSEKPDRETKTTWPLSLKAMLDNIESAPPFQRKSIEQHYTGLPIDLQAKFRSAEEKGGGMARVVLKVEDGSRFMLVFCFVKLSKYPLIKVLPEDSPIRVLGKIEEISDTSWIVLQDATLVF